MKKELEMLKNAFAMSLARRAATLVAGIFAAHGYQNIQTDNLAQAFLELGLGAIGVILSQLNSAKWQKKLYDHIPVLGKK